ncbi:hypothetical protein TUM4438_45520 [Shewanella sairae]|uniref:Uncharacterized protein n=1 Tax=Shewanella sairae TaxID=190310 RepID=A0ABQ4PS13_9GAMM|nr:hypothetical protein [Shewanella sairae]MCL1132635.1 hypothetical protein [Shewanella sairae]GIU52540.1 hypothetical protein TUM4438_45520 [Shewanella sairae]
MKKINYTGLFGALIGFIGLTVFLANGSISTKPLNAINGLAFSFSRGAGLPEVIPYALSCIVFLVVMALGYYLFTILSMKLLK